MGHVTLSFTMTCILAVSLSLEKVSSQQTSDSSFVFSNSQTIGQPMPMILPASVNFTNFNYGTTCQCIRAPCDCNPGSSNTNSNSNPNFLNIGGYIVTSSKSGSCPAVTPMLAVLQCRPACLSDNACPGTQKCCNYGGCPTCVANAVQSSSTINVGGYTIQSNRPGSCPAVTPMLAVLQCRPGCLSDSACPGTQKCCNYGGCPRCQAVISQPINNFPTSVSASKPGVCPVVDTHLMGACMVYSDSCRSDSSCSGTQKCCSSGCGRRCQSVNQIPNQPVVPWTFNQVNFPPNFNQANFPPITGGTFGNTGSASFKSGSCPVVSTNSYGICSYGCSMAKGDADCSGSQKCCSNGCGTVCTNPVNASG